MQTNEVGRTCCEELGLKEACIRWNYPTLCYTRPNHHTLLKVKEKKVVLLRNMK